MYVKQILTLPMSIAVIKLLFLILPYPSRLYAMFDMIYLLFSASKDAIAE